MLQKMMFCPPCCGSHQGTVCQAGLQGDADGTDCTVPSARGCLVVFPPGASVWLGTHGRGEGKEGETVPSGYSRDFSLASRTEAASLGCLGMVLRSAGGK